MAQHMQSLNDSIEFSQTHALNTGSSGAEALKALLAPAGSAAAAALLHSDPDVDQQLLISVHFQNKVKLHSISFTAQELANAPDDASGPRLVKVYANCDNLDFGEASSLPAVQTLELSPDALKGEKVPLRFVKFQSVSSVQLFIEENQDDSDVTFLNNLQFYGVPIDGFNMNDFKKGDEEH